MTFPKGKKFIALLILTFLLIIILILTNKTAQDKPSNFFIGSKNLIPQITKKPKPVSELIAKNVQNYGGHWGVYVKDLKNNQIYTFNAQDSFPSASIYKLAVMYKTYDSLKKGEIAKNEILSQDKITLQKLAQPNPQAILTDEEELEVVSTSVENALRAMITVSDNYTALLLAEKLTWQKIDAFMEEQNLPGIDLIGTNSPQVTATDVGKLLEKIYTGKAVDKKSSDEMKALLLAQQINDRIPKYLPSTVKVGHKTGELDFVRHDAGIIFAKESDYIFVFLTDTPAPQATLENIASLTKQIYDLLEN